MDSTERFSGRVENYVRYRPGYPQEVLRLLQEECGLTGASAVADIGSGTGILTGLLLESGARVYGVEPNQEMREASERLLHGQARLTSIVGTAEATTLGDSSADLITAGQAFHWFDHERARAEFLRILRPAGWVALVWNERRLASTPFLQAYERLLETCAPGYKSVKELHSAAHELYAFFSLGEYQTRTFTNEQVFDCESLVGRLLSSSYAPEVGEPGHDSMLDQLSAIFTAHQLDGRVTFEYDTVVYYGVLEV